MDDLLKHEPLSPALRTEIENFYQEAFGAGRHDFRAGRKIRGILENSGFQVTQIELKDLELSFNGPALPEVLTAWENRFKRMGGLKVFFQNDFDPFTKEFLNCLSSNAHKSLSKVICCIGSRSSQ